MAFRLLNTRRGRNQRARRSAAEKKSRLLRFDLLEPRTMLSLGAIVPAFPQFTYDSTGVVNYSPTTEVFDLTATPLSFQTSATSSSLRVLDGRSLAIQIHVDNSGNLLVMPGDGLTVTGAVTVNSQAYTGTLLTGTITDFGFIHGSSQSIDTYYFRFRPVDGSIGILLRRRGYRSCGQQRELHLHWQLHDGFLRRSQGDFGPHW